MKYIHNIIITVHVKGLEDKEALAQALAEFLPEQFEKENIILEEEEVKIDELTSMTILRAKITKERHTKQVITILKEGLGEEQVNIIRSQDNRVDDEGHMYIRLEKKALLEQGEAVLTDGGDCFHFNILLAAYPKTKEKALSVMKEVFN